MVKLKGSLFGQGKHYICILQGFCVGIDIHCTGMYQSGDISLGQREGAYFGEVDFSSCYAEIACVGYHAVLFKLIVDKYPAEEGVAEDKCDSEDIYPVCLKPVLEVESCGDKVLCKRDSEQPHIFSCIRQYHYRVLAVGEKIFQPALFLLDSFSAAHLNLSCLLDLFFFAFSVSYGAVDYGGYLHGVTAAHKRDKKSCTQGVQDDKVKSCYAAQGGYYGGDGLYRRGGHKMPHGKEKSCKGGDFL